VGTAIGIDDAILLRGAGWVQVKAGTSPSNSGNPYGLVP